MRSPTRQAVIDAALWWLAAREARRCKDERDARNQLEDSARALRDELAARAAAKAPDPELRVSAARWREP